MGHACSRTIRNDPTSPGGVTTVPSCSVPDGVARTCGPVGSLFLEPQGQTTVETWHYVGEGQGKYAKLQAYNFVGDGQGSFDRDSVATDYSGIIRKGCACAVVTLILGAICSALVAPSWHSAFRYDPSAREESGLTTQGPVAAAAAEASPSEFVTYTTHQPSTSETSAATQAPALVITEATSTSTFSTTRSLQRYQCVAGADDAPAAGAAAAEGESAASGWSQERKVWCCAHEGVACTTTTSAAAIADVGMPLGISGGGPSVSVSTVAPLVVATVTTTSAIAETDAASRASTTTAGTRSSTNTLSSTTSALVQPDTDPYDCQATDEWSVGQTDWCCRHYERGCMSSSLQPGMR